MAYGTRLHKIYSRQHGSFDRLRVRSDIFSYSGKVQQRTLEYPNFKVVVRGIYDDLEVNFTPPSTKTISIIEVKTTSKSHFTSVELAAGIFQTQLYVWLLTPLLNELGWKLDETHYLEVYSQEDGRLLHKLEVEAAPDMEEALKNIIESFLGLAPLHYPPEWVCKKTCPAIVKKRCEKWTLSHTS